MLRRLAWALPALALTATIFAVPVAGQVATPKASPVTTAGCPTPLLAQDLAASATKIERVALADGRTVTRFHMASTLEPGVVVNKGNAQATSPNTPLTAGYYWFYWSETWIDWLESNPCSGQDGYRFVFNARGYRSTEQDQSPRTNILSNFQLHAALEYDHGVGDWDPVWGHKFYDEDTQFSCSDWGGFHYFADNAPGKLRTWIRMRVRFIGIDYLTQWRKTTSRHLHIPSGLTFSGIGVGEFLSSPTNPGGALQPGC